MSLNSIVIAIEACLKAMDYLNAYYKVFGVFAEEISTHITLWNKLIQEHNRYLSAEAAAKGTGRKPIIHDAERIIAGYSEVLRGIEANKKLWTDRYIGVLYPEAKLKEIALQVEAHGLMVMPKDEAEKYFNFAHIIPFWKTLPNYTLIQFSDGGISFASPEFDMFEAMCWRHDEAARSKQPLSRLQTKLKSPEPQFWWGHYYQVLIIMRLGASMRGSLLEALHAGLSLSPWRVLPVISIWQERNALNVESSPPLRVFFSGVLVLPEL
jgi:hypothetical protein